MYSEFDLEGNIMSAIALIVLTRAIHVLMGIIWAGSTFLLGLVIMPIAVRYGQEGAGRWVGVIAQRVGPLSGVSALLTILSGIYLFASLHAHDDSMSGLVLKAGAMAALLSLAVGFFVGRPTAINLAKLSEQSSVATTTEIATQLSHRGVQLRRRAALSSGFAVILLGLAVLAMAAFRYVSALA
jgi:uncharacterized membrane protein